MKSKTEKENTIIIGRYALQRSSDCWIVTESYDGKDKKGDLKIQHKVTYWATIKQCASHIIDRESANYENIDALMNMLNKATCALEDYLKGIAEGHTEAAKQQLLEKGRVSNPEETESLSDDA